MRILVDENIPRMSVEALIASGHRVFDLRGTLEEGMDNAELWHKVQTEMAVLITTDMGFTEHRNERHFGLLVIRLRQPNRQKIHLRVMQAIEQFAESEWEGLTVVMKDQVQTVYRVKDKV